MESQKTYNKIWNKWKNTKIRKTRTISLKDYIGWKLNIDVFELEKNNNEKVTRKDDRFYR